jgi:hypothetical protein
MKKMKILTLSLAILLLLLVIGTSSAKLGVTYGIDWWVFSGGGAPSSVGNLTLDGSLGQSVIGPSSSVDYSIDAGYWLKGVYEIFIPLVMR